MNHIIISLSLLLMPALLSGCAPSETSERIPNYDFAEAELNDIPLEEAIAKAVQNDKKVVIDVYTDWCGYCRRMRNETYPAQSVQNALDEYYYFVRLNAESDEVVTYGGQRVSKRNLAVQLGATSYPTTVFLNNKGEPLGMQPGFLEADMFEKLLVYVGRDAYEHTAFEDFTIE